MSELDEFLRWVGQHRGEDWGGFGYGTLGGAIDIFRAERATGRTFTRWVDAHQALHPVRSRPADTDRAGGRG